MFKYRSVLSDNHLIGAGRIKYLSREPLPAIVRPDYSPDQRCEQTHHEIKHQVPQAGVYGAMDNLNEESREFDYLAAVPVKQIADVPEGLVGWEIPEAKYVVVTCTLPTIGKAFDYVYKNWLAQSGYERACGPEFEFYDEDFNPDDENSNMTICIPIKKAHG